MSRNLAFVVIAVLAQPALAAKWGKVVCTHVSQADAVQFAHESVFLDNWDYTQAGDPPYVAPKGSLACELPVLLTKTKGPEGGLAWAADVYFIGQPFKLAPCEVKYYDGRHPHKFKARGDGSGYFDLIPGTGDMDVFFDDSGTQFETDEYMAIRVQRDTQITWAGEIRDDRPHVPIVSNCHVEM